MSTSIKRDKQPKGGGKAPAFQIRISPDLKQQISEIAEKEGVSLGNWIKELIRSELKKNGITPKG
ncbi:type II toxin-antitoxin system HicB family antitoxin [Klebsiella pneumoniae]|uniref:Putative repressor n=1 Tax=Enterobacter cloacae TaxID=550 RepID=A0A0M7FVY2_ENTCL|nr:MULTISPECIES: toxin-antitoxin system HicB family antitoxin [Enterobacteriaceae]ELO0981368.1 toxin-antitoxin system HicB family antitoxin [Enterobacter asburiae]AFP69887.1 hypothetical protein ECENHK_10070 [Enterobacter kobei]EGS1684614.1 toxin-antitoxin system HicB family antitoxin [Enterobacter cloacae]KGB12693.1 ribbon-helix-helix, copG family protein [Enterobacter cloacae]MBL4448537.1 toxin-antitoxin system HicB family antitoxin [Klebsiella pneumoniae]